MSRLALLLPWLACAACTAFAQSDNEEWVTIGKGNLVVEVDVSGVLKATRSTPLNTPAVPGMWDFKIVRMAAEGSEAKPGMPVLFLDSSEMDQWLTERITERDRIDKEVAQKQNDIDLGRRDADLAVAEAEAAARKADVKADLPVKYTAEVTVKLARLDADAAQGELRMAKQRREQLMRLREAELTFLRDRLARAQTRVQEVQAAIRKMAVRAPVDGLVVYKSNWRNEKKKVGDSCWGGEVCMEIADVSEMVGSGQVEETESARVAVGQTVSVHLEAFPEIEWTGTVARLRPNVFRQSPKTPLKVIGVDITLAHADPARMRPHMQFRGRIQVDEVKGAVLLPLGSIFTRDSGPVAFRKTAAGWERAPLRLGRRNRSHAEVLSGLSDGDRVSRQDLEREGPSS